METTTAAMQGSSGSGGPRTINDVFHALGIPTWLDDKDDFLFWPPDVFAATALLLRDSGAYLRAVSGVPCDGFCKKAHEWQGRVQTTRDEWMSLPSGAPPRIKELWEKLKGAASTPVSQIGLDNTLWPIILELCCVADEASMGIGLPAYLDQGWICPAAMEMLLRQSQARDLSGATHGPASTVCKRIDPSRAIVLPKFRTPQRGITIRSMSLHLALITECDVVPTWVAPTQPDAAEQKPTSPSRDHKTHNLLLVPYPFDIMPRHFAPVDSDAYSGILGRLAGDYDMFTFHHEGLDTKFSGMMTDLLQQAKKIVGTVDGLVMPESALTKTQFNNWIKKTLPEELRFLVCGIYEPCGNGDLAKNYALIRCHGTGAKPDPAAAVPVDYAQHKHHCWALDESQIRMYGVASALDPRKVWWEAIQLPSRDLHFFALDEFCIFSVLICEDLARPDPIGDVIRSVGPNLVIGLLQDGPQLTQRWSARYATALADDPGSSVLTLTSLGMSQLSRPNSPSAEKPSRIVALWRDAIGGFREISLPQQAKALVISLTESKNVEFTADGRDDNQAAGCIQLGGIYAINENGIVL